MLWLIFPKKDYYMQIKYLLLFFFIDRGLMRQWALHGFSSLCMRRWNSLIKASDLPNVFVNFDKRYYYMQVKLLLPSFFIDGCTTAFSNLGLKQNRVPSSGNRVLLVCWRIWQHENKNPQMEGVCFSNSFDYMFPLILLRACLRWVHLLAPYDPRSARNIGTFQETLIHDGLHVMLFCYVYQTANPYSPTLLIHHLRPNIYVLSIGCCW
jgi:hypothetical protein